MRIYQTAALFVSLFLMTACGGKSVAGSYALDSDAMAKAVEAAMDADPETKSNPKEKQAALALFKSMTGDLDFKADGTFSGKMSMSMMGQKSTQDMTGTWKLSGAELEMTSTNAQNKTETKTGSFDGDKIIVVEDMGGQKVEMVFMRQS